MNYDCSRPLHTYCDDMTCSELGEPTRTIPAVFWKRLGARRESKRVLIRFGIPGAPIAPLRLDGPRRIQCASLSSLR